MQSEYLKHQFRHHGEFLWHTNFRLIGLSILWKLDELLGEHARTVAQNVALKLDVRVGSEELQDNGVTGGINPNLHILSSDCGGKTTHSHSAMSELFELFLHSNLDNEVFIVL